MDLLKKFHEETKTTIVVITHKQDSAGYAERQIKLEDCMIKSPAEWKENVLIQNLCQKTTHNVS